MNIDIPKIEESVPGTLVHLAYRGSIAHGMHDPDPSSIDDVDLIGIYFAPTSHYVGIEETKDTIEIKDGRLDVVLYEFRKFVRLVLKQNPNVLSLLYHGNLYSTGNLERYLPRYVASREAYHSFGNYAKSQLDKMTRHKMNPVREQFIAQLQLEIKFHEAADHPDDRLLKELRKRLSDYMGTAYMGEKRRELVEQFGFDTKNAAHCIRLLKMGAEFLSHGYIIVDRSKSIKINPYPGEMDELTFVPDADELLSIKGGEWKLEEVLAYAKDLLERIDLAYENSPLPEQPDRGTINEITEGILGKYVTRNYVESL